MAKKPKRSKIPLAVIFVALSFGFLLIFPQTAQAQLGDDNQYAIRTGIAEPLLLVEYADYTNTSQYLTMSDGGYAQAYSYLPVTWTGYELYALIYDLHDTKNWISNYDFSSGTDDGYENPPANDSANVTDWTFFAIDVGNTNDMSGNYNDTGGNPAGTIELRMDSDRYESGGTWWNRYNEGDMCLWNETTTIPRGTVIDATLGFDVLPVSCAMFNSWALYFKVNAITVHRIGIYDIRGWGMDAWHRRSVNVDAWSNSTPLFSDPVNGTMTFEVGLEYTATSASYSDSFTDIRYQHLWLDNLQLNIKAECQPDQVELKMNTENVTSASWAVGEHTINDTWTSSPVIANFSVVAPNATVDMFCDLRLNITRQSQSLYREEVGKYGIRFELESNSPVNWTLFIRVSVPNLYENYLFNISITDNWNVSFVSQPQTPLDNNVSSCIGGKSGDGYLYVPAYQITPSPNGYWSIRAQSPNCMESAISSPISVRVENTLEVSSQINNTMVADASSYSANLTILKPDGMLYITSSALPFANGTIFFDVIDFDEMNDPAGWYKVYVDWAGNGKAGRTNTTFMVIRPARFAHLHPVGAEAHVEVGSPLTIVAQLHDNITDGVIAGANVSYRADWETSDIWNPLTVSDNSYVATITVPSSLGGGKHHVYVRVETEWLETYQYEIEVNLWRPWYIYIPGIGRISGWLFISFIALGGFLGAVLYAVLGRYIKYPAMVRKIIEMKKSIQKGKIPRPLEVRTRADLQKSVFSQEISPVDKIAVPGLPIVEPSPDEIEITSEGILDSEMETPPETEIEEISTKNINQKAEQAGETKRPTEKNKQIPETGSPEIDKELDAFRDEINGIEGLSDSDKETILKELGARPPDERRKTLDLIKEEVKND